MPAKVVNVKQYPIPGGEEEITQTIQALQQVGIRETMTALNNPIWPVRKLDGTWTVTADYRKLNKITPPHHLQLWYQI